MSSSNNLFSDSTSIDSGVDDLQNPKFDYTGNFDRHGFRDGHGCQTWDRPFQHKYAGCFIYNNMHDKGFYFVRQEDGDSFYDGQFYNNKLEGYGQVIYKDGRAHEGLFKDNRKFGPGVLSYPDGTQDVGLWNGNYLIRLSISMSSDIVPSLCNNPVNKVKLLRFKKIVPALPERKDLAKDLMDGLTEDQALAPRYPELYNQHVRNENSLFFDRRFYDLAQLGSEDTLIEVLEDEAFVDALSDITDAEDNACPCIDERCVHVTKQINEMESELRRIHDLRTKYEEQLQKCKVCCKIHPPCPFVPVNSSSHNSTSESADGFSNDEDIKYPSRASSHKNNFFPKQGVEKNLEQMRMQTSIVEDIIINELETMQKILPDQNNEESINKIFMSTKQFHSDASMNSSDQEKFLDDVIEKYTCMCIDEEIPNADFLEEQLEKLQQQEKFYHTVVESLNRVLYKEFSTLHKSNFPKIVKIPVEDLLAWNNGKTAIEILQHSFRYRNFEKLLTYNIKSLLIGDRTAFAKLGRIESICISFLKHCVSNDIDEVRRDLFYHNVYPDLSDARGNTGLHLAVTFDHHEIIRQLANVGANLDVFNDECLTPLILSLLRYIATSNRVVFWDKAFLSELILNPRELDQVTQWRPHESLVSLGEFVGSMPNMQTTEHRSYTGTIKKSSEEMSVKIRSHLQSIKSSSISARINLNYLFSTSFVEDYEKYKKIVASKKVDDVEEKDVAAIVRTIEILLHYGADPNIGDLPMKPVLLSIFTKNLTLVEKLLQHAANPNSSTEEDLTALHILASLPFNSKNVQIADMFLRYSCDPNKKTSNDFWMEQNEELIGTYVSPLTDFEDYEGKTSLQMAVMRKDFDEDNVGHQCDLIKTLIQYGALHDHYYLGHTLLSMAVLRGNNKLIETLHNFVELGQPLGENMGNALTVLGLYRFQSVRPFNYCKSTIDVLISLGMNPFNPVYDFANIFEFFLYDYSNHVDFDIPRIRANLEANDASMRRLIYSNDLNLNKDCNRLSVAYLKEIGRNILMTLYRYKAVQILLLFASEDLLYHKCLENMAKLFTIQEALDCVKLFIKKNNVILDMDYEENILRVLNFIRDKSVRVKDMKKDHTKNAPITQEPSLIFQEEISKLHKKYEVPNYIVMYALDSNPDKYEVCFHCMRKSNKKLISCPCCDTVKFCSEMCNKYNMKLGTKHACNLFFYDETKTSQEKPSDMFPLTGIDLLMLEAKQTREEERLAEQLLRQAEEEEKLKKQLRKSQRGDSQVALQASKSRSRSLMDRSTSVCFILDKAKKKKKKPTVCCRRPSSIFICDETAQMAPRKFNCGFHCGQVIPDVNIDEEGNIVREKEFCECYPMYKKDHESAQGDEKERGVARPSEQLSTHYSLSDIWGGAFRSGEREMRDVEELDMLINTFTKEERRKSSGIEEVKEEEILEPQKEIETEGEVTETAKKHKPKKSESFLGKKKKSKKSDTKLEESEDKLKEITEETDADTKQKKKKDSKKKGKAEKKVKSDTEIEKEPETDAEPEKKKKKEKDTKKKGKPSKKVKSDTEIIKKKKEEKKDDGSKTAKKRKKSKSKSESEISLQREEKKQKKKKEISSESELDVKKKKKKKGREDKSVGGSSKHDKKTMTKEPKDKGKKKKKEEGTQADIEHKVKKPHETSSKSTTSSIKKKKRDESSESSKKPERKKQEKKIPEKNKPEKKKPEKKKPEKKKPEKKKLEKKEPKKKITKSTKKTLEKKSKREVKERPKSKKSDKRVTERKEKPKKVLQQKTKTDEKIPVKLFERHTDKTKRDVAISKTLASFKAIDSKLLDPEKLLALTTVDFKEFKKISRVYQYFLELIATYFPDFDLSCLMLPFACFMDGQLYYKFADALPYYCRTYSTI
ncbi:uncharacterized protein LOC123316721 [Coccinella septempunctata]|uniref:uncharacterized protein LOC123316721 n=1 Tax=Coccinella septempunctata TaxID=41139 RepID=UPI001D06F088|nr:uncharacterized protein LOC123316721 [Coccinella septempunctata]